MGVCLKLQIIIRHRTFAGAGDVGGEFGEDAHASRWFLNQFARTVRKLDGPDFMRFPDSSSRIGRPLNGQGYFHRVKG